MDHLPHSSEDREPAAAPIFHQLDQQWADYLKRVQVFMEQHGRQPRATCDDRDEEELGGWCVRQRKKHGNGTLRPDRAMLVEQSGVLALPNEPEFVERVQACAAFIRDHGHPPRSVATDPVEKALYYWRAGQQHLHSIGRLKPHRLRILTDNGILQTAFEYEWDWFFQRLQSFIAANNRPPVRLSPNREEAQLGQWRQTQYLLYKSGRVDARRAKMLESVGVATTIPNMKWNSTFTQLQAFVKGRGRLPARTSRDKSERQMARWLETQRDLRRTGTLLPRRKRLIDSLDMPVDRLEERWEKICARVRTFLSKNGRLPSTNAVDDTERGLAVWCSVQRKGHREGTLLPQRVQPVIDLGLLLDRKVEQWKTRLKEVYKFKKQHRRLPDAHATDRSERILGRWCSHQNYLQSLGRLKKERRSVLLAAGIIRAT
jgi:hypothetical protein